MNSDNATTNDVPGSALALRWVGVSLLGLSAFAGPLLFGAVERWAWGALWFVSAAAAGLALVVWIIEGRATLVFAPVIVVAGIVALVAVWQLAPLPEGFFILAGPRAQAVYERIAPGGLERLTLSAGATFEAFLKAATILTAGFAALALTRTRAMIFVLLAAALSATLAAGIIGLLQEKGESEKIYWVRDLTRGARPGGKTSARLDPALSSGVSTVEGVLDESGAIYFRRVSGVGDVFGPYANSNHFGGLVEITLPMAFALLVALLAARRSGWAEEGGLFGTIEGSMVMLLLFLLAVCGGALWYAGTLGALGGVGVGFAVVFALMAFTRRVNWGSLVVLVILAGALLAPAVWNRDDLRREVPWKFTRRSQVWRDTLEAARDFPIFGSGLGSYRDVMPHYESSETKFLFAHNDYLQFALEAGLPALAISAVFVLWQMGALAKGTAAAPEPYCAAICAGAVGSAAALGFHSLLDYNLHVPANVMVFSMISCAAAVASRASRADLETLDFEGREILTGRLKLVGLALLGVLVLAAVSAAVTVTVRADRPRRRARAFLAGVDGGGLAGPINGASILSEKVARAEDLARWDGDLSYCLSRLLWLEADGVSDAGRAESLKAAALKKAIRAARRAPAASFRAMTAVSLGAKDSKRLWDWQVSSFDYKYHLARMAFDRGRVVEGLELVRQAVCLEAPEAGGEGRKTTAAVDDLLRRFGTYEMIEGAIPQTFGGHLLFGKAFTARGIVSAGGRECEAAVKSAGGATRAEGFTEHAVLDLAQLLIDAGRLEMAAGLLETTLSRRDTWQWARLEYANLLLRLTRYEEARKELDRILRAKPGDDLLKAMRQPRGQLEETGAGA